MKFNLKNQKGVVIIIVLILFFMFIISCINNSEYKLSVADGEQFALSSLRLAIAQSSLDGTGTFSTEKFNILGKMVKKINENNQWFPENPGVFYGISEDTSDYKIVIISDGTYSASFKTIEDDMGDEFLVEYTFTNEYIKGYKFLIQDDSSNQQSYTNNAGYTITFDSNGGSNIDPIVVNRETVLKAPNPPTKEGYTFLGWLYDGKYFSFSNSKSIKSDITLVAQWMKTGPTEGVDAHESNNDNYSTSPSTHDYNHEAPIKTNTSRNYQQIYNEYSSKLINSGPTSSIREMAEILNEGITKMAEYMYSASGTDGQYATYESWAQKLTEVYMNNCR